MKTSLRAGWMHCGYGFTGSWLQTTSAVSWLWLHSRDEKRAGARVPSRHTRSLLYSAGDRASAFERASGPQTARPGNGGARLISVGGPPPHATSRVGTPSPPPLQREANQPGFAIETLAKGSGCLAGPPAGLSSP